MRWRYRQQPVSEIRYRLQHAEDHQRAEQAQALHQHAAVQRTDNGRQQAERFIHQTDITGAEAHAANQESGGERSGERVAQLVEND